jgi:hypothetical protein
MADGGGGGTYGVSPSQEKGEKAAAKTFEEKVAAVAGSLGGGTATQDAKDPLVYLGHDDSKLMGEMRFTGGTKFYDKSATLTQTAGQYFDWDDTTRNKFLSQLNLAGYDTNQLKDGQIAQLWATYAQQAASYYAQGRKMTPWDVLAMDMQQREKYLNTPRSVTQTSTAFDMSTKEDAHAIFMQAAQSLLGRDPTKSEVSSFQSALNAYEKANPTVTTQTTNYLGDTVTGQTSTTKGGVKGEARQLMAVEDVKADPEFGAYQAATTYFDAMMQMIGG